MALYKDGGFVADPWRTAIDGVDMPPTGGVILSLPEWRAARDLKSVDGRPVGIRIEPGDPIAEILPDLDRMALVALSFPTFSDGRSFSKARMLRADHGFRGEIRAVGEVLWDQLQLMTRCGFDAFEISDTPTLRALKAGKRPLVTDYYQPGSGAETREGTPPGRPWTRRASAQEPAIDRTDPKPVSAVSPP